jgi:hypothetical protein
MAQVALGFQQRWHQGDMHRNRHGLETLNCSHFKPGGIISAALKP